MRLKVILQEKIRSLGGIGDIVEVKGGYARNYLLPKQKARVATKQNIATVEVMRAELEKIERERVAEATVRAQAIQELGKLRIQVQTNEEGKLFGGVSAAEIVDLLAQHDTTVHKNEVSITDGPIRIVGEYTIRIECYADVYADLSIEVFSDTVRNNESSQNDSDDLDEDVEGSSPTT